MINVSSEVGILEIDGKEPYSDEVIVVRSITNNKMVEICIGGKAYLFHADDLLAAIKNATNTAKE